MTAANSSTHDRNQLAPSIDKLFHYLISYVVHDTTVRVFDESGFIVYEKKFLRPRSISISPTLYTRIDGCHGAGNCCRVPFDLVYTDYDYQRIVQFDRESSIKTFGDESTQRFDLYRDQLLNRLIPLRVSIEHHNPDVLVTWETRIWVQRNTTTFDLSGNKSCPYLFIGGDRYFCGVHPFKPLHCWYPHMVVRVTDPRVDGERPSVTIGRMQYGRNHKFGCPVLFEESIASKGGNDLFGDLGQDGPYYFDEQYKSDYEKLKWTANSAKSMGFMSHQNSVVHIHDAFDIASRQMMKALSSGNHQQITLFNN